MASRKQSTPVTLPATKVRRNFGDVIQRTYSGDEHFIVERDGLPVVAIISMAEYQELLQARGQHEREKEQRLQQFDRLSRKMGQRVQQMGLSEEDADALIEDTRQQLYDERHG
jgi:prevent-host-death family protein